ncbi:MAG: hypothetical protein IRY83_03230 [Chloroflexi bacterium]|jgi:hypothetical protein|nr:hypothetical protein [Chloroflexota bacterium]HLG52115.1 hypothetical protein [Chloroflexota bacterium]
MIENISIQDRDLLGRLNAYFDNIELRLREGQGWLIFNADSKRASRIGRFIQDRLREYRPLVSFYVVPWRDFALNAYVLKVELASSMATAGGPPGDARVRREYAIAGRVSQDMYYQMRYCDLFVLSGVRPSHPHEFGYLDQIIAERCQNQRASILITPLMPHELEEGFRSLGPGDSAWKRFFGRLYDTCLIAL